MSVWDNLWKIQIYILHFDKSEILFFNSSLWNTKNRCSRLGFKIRCTHDKQTVVCQCKKFNIMRFFCNSLIQYIFHISLNEWSIYRQCMRRGQHAAISHLSRFSIPVKKLTMDPLDPKFVVIKIIWISRTKNGKNPIEAHFLLPEVYRHEYLFLNQLKSTQF